jgi:zinc D-Ala-D-Ala carboxypeptidase
MARNKSKSTEPAQAAAKQEIPQDNELPPDSWWQGIQHFVPKEFTCKCNGYCDHSVVIAPETVAKLEQVRERIGKPVTITSGTRCERYNRMVRGTLGSAHVPRNGVSHAADVRCPDSEYRFAFLAAALPLFHRIGVGKDFIHVDDDPDQPANVMWLY